MNELQGKSFATSLFAHIDMLMLIEDHKNVFYCNSYYAMNAPRVGNSKLHESWSPIIPEICYDKFINALMEFTFAHRR